MSAGRAKAHLTPRRSSGNRPMQSTTSRIGKLSRAYALVRRESPGDDPRGDGGAPGYARRAKATPDERLKPFEVRCKD